MGAVGANQKVVEQRPGKQAADSAILSTYASIVGIEYAVSDEADKRRGLGEGCLKRTRNSLF